MEIRYEGTGAFLLIPDSKTIVYEKAMHNSSGGVNFGLYSSPITASVPVTIDSGNTY